MEFFLLGLISIVLLFCLGCFVGGVLEEVFDLTDDFFYSSIVGILFIVFLVTLCVFCYQLGYILSVMFNK